MAQQYTTTLNADGSITLKPIGARFVVVADVQPPPPPVDPSPVDPPPGRSTPAAASRRDDSGLQRG